MNPDQLTNKGDVDFSQVRPAMEASRVRADFAISELERLDKWIEAERAGASLPTNTVDAIILIAEERGKQYMAAIADKHRIDWLDNRIVKVHECMCSDTPFLFEHVPAGYGLRDDTDLRKSIDAATK